MAEVEIVRSLVLEIKKRFDRGEANRVIDLIESTKDHPHKGKPLGPVGGLLIKEVRYRDFRFYFLVDAEKLKFFDEAALADLLLRLVRMSDKKTQARVIEEIRQVLLRIGPAGF